MAFVSGRAEPQITLWWGRAAPTCLLPLEKVELSRRKRLECEGPLVPVNQLQVVAIHVLRVWDQPVLDVNLVPSALKL